MTPFRPRILIVLALLAAACGAPSNEPTAAPASDDSSGAADVSADPVTVVQHAMRAAFVDFDAAGVEAWFAEDYIQHNPGVPTGRAPIVGFLPALQESGITAETHRVLSEGNLVVLHSTYRNAQLFGGQELVAFDVFRVENGRVAEHWDNLQPLQEETASGRSQTDGPTEVTNRDRTADNRATVEAFVRDVLQGGAPGRITDYVSTETYHQHNPQVGDGLPALGEALAAMAANGQAMTYTLTPIVVADGNFVFTASEGTLGETPTAFFDLFRLADGKIVEHWDVIAAIPAEMAHDNGKF